MYSTDADLYNVLPNASNYVDSSLTATTFYASLRTWASTYIDNRIKRGTLTPSNEDLSEVEANLVAYRLLRQNFSSKDQDASREFYKQYKRDADEALDCWVFPSTYSAPIRIQDFASSASTASIAVTTYDEYTYDANWVAKCSQAGATNAQFTIWNSRKQSNWLYDLAEHTQFPDQDHIDAASPEGLIKEIKVTITHDPAVEFTLGDSWSFRTYSRWSRKDVRGFGTIPIIRG